jgi:hypothetical protein
MASKEINYDLLQSARKPKSLDGSPLSPRDTKRQSLTKKLEPKFPTTITPPASPTMESKPSAPNPSKPPKIVIPALATALITNKDKWEGQPLSTRKMMKDKIAHEVRKSLEEPGIDPHAEFVKSVFYFGLSSHLPSLPSLSTSFSFVCFSLLNGFRVFPEHQAFKAEGCWQGMGTVKNPWRNNPQLKVGSLLDFFLSLPSSSFPFPPLLPLSSLAACCSNSFFNRPPHPSTSNPIRSIFPSLHWFV